MLRPLLCTVTAVLSLIVLAPHAVYADNTYAKRTLAELEQRVSMEAWEQAEIQLETVKDALKDADAATAGPIKKRLAEIEKLTTAGVKAVKRERVIRDIEGAIRKAKEYIEDKRSCEDLLDEAKAELDAEDNQQYLDEATKKSYFSEMAVVRKQMVAKHLVQSIEALTAEVDSAQKKWPEIQTALGDAKERPAAAESAATEMSHALDAAQRAAEGLPTDNPKVQQQLAKLQKLKSAFEAAYGSTQAAEAYETLNRFWNDQLTQVEGWEQETTAPKFSQMIKEQNAALSRIGAPKTAELISLANQWLKNRDEDPNFQALQSDAKIKALHDKVVKARAAGWKKITGFATGIVKEAESTTLDQNSRDRLEQFANDDLRLSLEGAPELPALQERALALVKKFDEGAAGSSQAAEKLYEELTAQAAQAWPAMAAKFSPVAFDANAAMKNIGQYKGKIIRFQNANNRMGWDYRPGTFDFAVEVDGQHVAGKYAPLIKKAVDDATEKTGKDFSNDEYDVIAEVIGTGPITRIDRAEAKVKFDDGSSADVRGQKDESVEGIHVKVIGLHLGPVAAAVGQGVVDQSGKVEVPAGVPADTTSAGGSYSAGTIWLRRFMLLLLGLSASLFVLLKSGFQPVTSVPQLQGIRSRLTPTVVAGLGWLFIVYSAYLLLSGYIIYGLLVSLAFGAAGLFLALESLEKLQWLKPPLNGRIRSLGTEIGLAVAGIMSVNFVLGMIGLHFWVI